MGRKVKTAAAATFFLLAVIALWEPAIAADTPTAMKTNAPACAPTKGDGARWIAPCEAAVKAGKPRAALILGEIYWNGDGIPKDHAAAVRWWKIADQAGVLEAAKLLGNDAYVRAMQGSTGPESINRGAMEEAIDWYTKAAVIEPNAAQRQEAKTRLDQLTKFKSLLPPQ